MARGEHFIKYFDFVAAPMQPGFDIYVIGGVALALALIYVTMLSRRGRGDWPTLLAIAVVSALSIARFEGFGPPFDYRTLKLAIAKGEMQTVEGVVTKFHPMPAGGHEEEHFEVAGVYFAYSDFDITASFNNAASHGGPLRDGLHVRIAYVKETVGFPGNRIVRLEIRWP